MARYALINKEQKVVNIIVWEGKPWSPPADHFVIQSDIANIGDEYQANTGKFIGLPKVTED